MAGLPETLVTAAAEAAKQAGLEGKWVFTLHAPSIWPFISYADNRELRRQIFTAYIQRGDNGNGAGQQGRAPAPRVPACGAGEAAGLRRITPASFWKSGWPKRRNRSMAC